MIKPKELKLGDLVWQGNFQFGHIFHERLELLEVTERVENDLGINGFIRLCNPAGGNQPKTSKINRILFFDDDIYRRPGMVLEFDEKIAKKLWNSRVEKKTAEIKRLMDNIKKEKL